MTLCFSAQSVHSIIGAMAKTLSNVLFPLILLKLASKDRRALASIAYFGVKRYGQRSVLIPEPACAVAAQTKTATRSGNTFHEASSMLRMTREGSAGAQ
jgi:hypothetical protein